MAVLAGRPNDLGKRNGSRQLPRPGATIYGQRPARLAATLLELLDLSCRAIENLLDTLQLGLVIHALRRVAVHGLADATKCVVDVHHGLVKEALDEASNALEYRVNRRAVFREISAAFGSDRVDFSAPLVGSHLRIAEVFEHRQRRIHGTRTRRVRSAKTVLELLDDLVAVSWLLLE